MDTVSKTAEETVMQLDGYTLTEKLYQGSRTVVYRATCERTQRPVVIKFLSDEFPSFNELVQFNNQFTIAKDLDNPYIVKPIAMVPCGNASALVMEDFGGYDLKRYFKYKPKQLGESTAGLILFFQVVVQVASALEALSRDRIIHKDIKPANILINPNSHQVKLIDFSIASTLPRETQNIQNPNILEGTLAYLSPEQTGRMNRGIDYRSDFYALGVTCYELLTGQLPFTSDDPMDVVHGHLARQPVPLGEHCPEVPDIVSDIVLKLLAKNAEDRYQSAYGIRYDFQRCLNDLKELGHISPFELGAEDVSDRFQLSEKLYGRQQEISHLLAAFERISEGNTELMLVAGISGIGKTAIVNEVHKPIARQRGYFIQGKYDQLQHNVPLSAFIQAFRGLIKLLITESDAQLEHWRVQIKAALGRDSQVVVDVVPELERLIGPQPPAAELDTQAAEHRFNRLIQNFVEVFASAHHPLVLFLDDLQWADAASLRLLKRLMQGKGYLLILGAYRDNEVSVSHPLMLCLEDIETAYAAQRERAFKQHNAASDNVALDSAALSDEAPTEGLYQRRSNVNHLPLSPLSERDITRFVADTLRRSKEDVAEIAQTICQKTDGNPFFSAQLLRALHEQGHIQFDAATRRWDYDLNQIKAALPSDNVLEFMSSRLERLPEGTQQILRIAACIGAQFDFATLVVADGNPVERVALDLWCALEEGLVLLATDSAKAIAPTNATALLAINPTYHFFHDRIQQAAYQSISAEQQASVHRKIGLRLLNGKEQAVQCVKDKQIAKKQNTKEQNTKGSTEQTTERQLFDIVNHLNQGAALIETEQERDRLIKLNLNAGRKAKAAIAHDTALAYFQAGIRLLPPNSWDTHYRLTLSLHQRAAKAAAITDKLVMMQHHADRVMQHAKTLLDKTPTYETQIQAAIGQNHLLSGLEITIQVLAQLGIVVSSTPSEQEIETTLQRTADKIQQRLAGNPISDLVNLPETEDPTSIVIIRLLARAVSAAYIAKPEVLPLLVCIGINRCLDFGHTPLSSFLYTWYGLILCSNPLRIAEGCAVGRLSLDLVEKIPSKEVKNRITSIAYFFVLPWETSIHKLIAPFKDNYYSSLEDGDREYAAWSLFNHGVFSLFAGEPLDKLSDELARHRDSISQLQQDTVFNYISIYYQFALNLLGQNAQPTEVEGNAYSKSKQLPIQMAASDYSGLAFFHIAEGILRYLFGSIEQAKHSFNNARKYSRGAVGSQWLPLFYFYDSLACLASLESSVSSESSTDSETAALSDRALQSVINNQASLKIWATSAPENHLHRWHLVEAERCRIYQDRVGAIEHYDQAIAFATEHNFEQEAALANEITAKYYLEWGKTRVAQGHMIEAYYGYSRWGARAKIAQIEKLYPALLKPALQEKQQSISSTNTILAYANTTGATTTSSTGVSELIDLSTLLHTSQIISREIELEKLLAALIGAVIQNAGADKCALLMPKADEWVIEAFCELGENPLLLQSKPIKAGELLPVSLINQVRHTCESVVVFNATVHAALTVDPYVLRERPKSILCTPLLNQNKIIAILYLENNLTIGAFTDHRVEILNLICAQAAISLENARLYQQAQQALEDLQNSHMQLVQSEKMSALGNLVAGVAHEINNPVNFLKGNVKPALNYVTDLVDLLDMVIDNEPRADILEEMEEINLPFIKEDLPSLLHSMTFGISRIQDISTSLRTFSRSDKQHKTAFNLHDGLDSTLLILKHRLQRGDSMSPIQVAKHYDPDLPEIQCFAGQLNQVFMNLIANAIEAMGEVKEENTSSVITITTEGIALDEEGIPRSVRVSVADNGPGMNEDIKSRVFEHLFTTKPVGKGTGLGLAISYDIIAGKHDGELRVESEEGKGTVFIIELPVGFEAEPEELRA